MQKQVGYHIFRSAPFDEVFSLFFKKIEDFHQLYVDDLIIYGLINMGKIDISNGMEINPSLDLDQVDALNEILAITPPIIEVEHVHDKVLDTSLSVFYVPDPELIKGFYMSELVIDVDNSEESHYQLWKLNCSNRDLLNNHWL